MIENTLERIATALERLAGAQPAAIAAASEPAPKRPLLPGVEIDNIKTASAAQTEPPPRGRPELRVAQSPATSAQGARTNDRPAAASGHGGKVVSFDEMKAALVAVKGKFGPEVSRGIMQKVGAANVQEIKPDDYPKVVAECQRAMAG
jgi:hypothetical protein